MSTMPSVHADALWTIERGISPIIATAIHDGHAVRKDLEGLFALSSDRRLREEDPFTGFISLNVPNRIVFHRSRFEVDLNRSRDGAIYFTPEQAWGLKVWKDSLPSDEVETSLRTHDHYYEVLLAFLKGIERWHGRFVVLDIHSYNYRRAGPAAAPTARAKAPDINIGTSSIDRVHWSYVLDALMNHFRTFEIDGRPLDVRENIVFQGKGEQTRFIHEHFPLTGCAIAVEFKKFFMDEWTGEPDVTVLEKLRGIIASAVPLLEQVLESRR
ncbi:hypothetical protein GGD46_005081 [Rhizobium lusitanum]|uniref:N-formylglutamate amidohydrolase n=2 Tax=Rhizobium lusitanum TaxID=293958 RepID=A0A7X0IXW9_9HYPH|nr:hypothetical protein [Rhizobium lusitanum]